MNEQTVMDAMQTDVEAIWFGSAETKIWYTPFGVDLIVPEKFLVEDLPDGSSVVKNDAGVVQSRRAADAYYMDPVGVPLAELTSPSEFDRFDALFERWDYSSVYDEPIEMLAARAKQQYESTDRAVAALWRFHYIQSGQIMRGYEQFLIEMGVDALNPVQVSAAGMNPRDLVREYGKDIAFWGGGCDSQNALNSPDTQVVRNDVRRRFEEFGTDAHWVFTQVHNIQYDVPAENILALHDEFHKLSR